MSLDSTLVEAAVVVVAVPPSSTDKFSVTVSGGSLTGVIVIATETVFPYKAPSYAR